MAFRRRNVLNQVSSARVQIQQGVWKQGIEGQKEIKKAWLSGVGSLKTVGHHRRCGVDNELLDKALVLEIPNCFSDVG